MSRGVIDAGAAVAPGSGSVGNGVHRGGCHDCHVTNQSHLDSGQKKPGSAVLMRNVIVTGASRGIGRAIAQRFASAGDRLCVHYSSGRSQAEETVGSLVPSPLGEHFIVAADLSKEGSARTLIELALEQFAGHLDVLVINHGV